jgi:hypothetical protein
MGFLTAPLMFGSRGISGSVCLMALLSVSIPATFVEGREAMEICTPSLQIEIGLPQDASVTSKFGETDHYLAATLDTVTVSFITFSIMEPESITHRSQNRFFNLAMPLLSGVITTQMQLHKSPCNLVKLSRLRLSHTIRDMITPK